MFYYINGLLTLLRPDCAVLDCGGVGYLLNISAATFGKLSRTHTISAEGNADGGKAKLYTHFSVKEDGQELYGFFDEEERDIFRLLIGVCHCPCKRSRIKNGAEGHSRIEGQAAKDRLLIGGRKPFRDDLGKRFGRERRARSASCPRIYEKRGGACGQGGGRRFDRRAHTQSAYTAYEAITKGERL